MKTVVEMIEALIFKIRIFGIWIKGPTNAYYDNEDVTKNITIPE